MVIGLLFGIKNFFSYFLSYYNVRLITKIFHHIPIDNFICSLLTLKEVKDFFFYALEERDREKIQLFIFSFHFFK